MEKQKLGATGKFPDGKIKEDDEGELRFGVTTSKDLVILDFGVKVKWIGMDPKLAKQLGELLIKKARSIE
jgi:hypothetical protein